VNDKVINVELTHHFLERMIERCSYLKNEEDVFEFLLGIKNGLFFRNIKKEKYADIKLGVPELGCIIPLAKSEYSKKYTAITYINNIIYTPNTKACTINWYLGDDTKIEKIIEKMDVFE